MYKPLKKQLKDTLHLRYIIRIMSLIYEALFFAKTVEKIKKGGKK